jgi:hypothetical protein
LLKQKLEEFEIVVSFDQSKQAENFKKKPIEFYLQENRDCDSKSLKKRLIEEGFK